MVDEIFKDREDVPAVADHAVEQFAELGLAGGFFVPFRQNRGGDFDIAAQLLRRVATQKQPIEKGRFTLREFELPQDVFNRVGRCGHNESAVYRFRRSRQEVTCVRGN